MSAPEPIWSEKLIGVDWDELIPDSEQGPCVRAVSYVCALDGGVSRVLVAK